MSQKNFVSYGDAETVLSEFAGAIKALDPEGGNLDTRLTALENMHNPLWGYTADYNGKTYFIPELYQENVRSDKACVVLAYVLGENNGLAIAAINSVDISGFSYVEGQLCNAEMIRINNDSYWALKMSDDTDVGVGVICLGNAY